MALYDLLKEGTGFNNGRKSRLAASPL